MANCCASLDQAWSHFPAPASSLTHAAWFSPAAAAFENDTLATALVRASVSSPSTSPTPSTSTVSSSASELSSIPHDAPAASPAPLGCRLGTGRSQTPGPCTGRVSKRKPRATSRRAQTTYISADPADFRRMVQEITGFTTPGTEHASSAAAASPAPPTKLSPLSFLLPTLDTSAAFLRDRAPSQPRHGEDKTSGGAGRATMAAEAEAGAGDSSSLLLMQELEAMVSAPAVVPAAFPTLESWGMII